MNSAHFGQAALNATLLTAGVAFAAEGGWWAALGGGMLGLFAGRVTR